MSSFAIPAVGFSFDPGGISLRIVAIIDSMSAVTKYTPACKSCPTRYSPGSNVMVSSAKATTGKLPQIRTTARNIAKSFFISQSPFL